MYICRFIDIYLKRNAGQKAKNRDFTLLTKLSYDKKKAFFFLILKLILEAASLM